MLKITALFDIKKSNSSMGNWCIPLDIEYISGLKANTFLWFFNKKKAIEKYNTLKVGNIFNSVTEI